MSKEKETKICIDEASEIKEKYEDFMTRFDLPDFTLINEDFDISKIDCDSLTLLRDVRKAMTLKFSSVMQFVELLLNPVNGNMFSMYLVRGVNGEEKKILSEMFDNLGVIEINSIGLDIVYSEEGEVKFVKESFDSWQKMKPKLMKVVDSLKLNWRKVTGKKSKSYFG
jgi:hypothetical protein